ncbi:hypothetical protein GPEL0_01r4461 [Geoanaerobacter pelophilus]|uniref:DUF2288 domain-containing protein n=1 Tax=Geoanaerobacter pelophilus TaxID=60036 RepID=A0ABQ0MPP0_9BACT|nr:DUF2288 domain-containing protein [Geoanaerobacter pelophilus]GAW68221.1 hypothetical protein GPEL0_01r4461 [Geoanaerobacter pelophilus]
MSATKEELATKIDTTDWMSLRAHLERGGVIIVDHMLDLAEVAAAVANDEVKTVERWLLSGVLSKPSAEQIKAWDADSGKSFLCLIVSPYVLAQEERPAKG